ncbi:MAG: ABC transporter ATP-binding protein [Herpetosiphonaceae bacterium]|nr:ABC transporter ATP-binding protein [Herpetosiphonaceae bacterium]
MNVIDFEHVSRHFVLQRDRRNSLHERVTGLFKPRLPKEEFWAVRDVSFCVAKGETLGLIGHNGSGKSTTLKLITRILEPTAGRVAVQGRISALLELGSGFHPDLTGRENIYLNGSLLGFNRAEMSAKLNQIIDFSELRAFIDMPVKHYSSGMYMRLAFAVAINVNPDILITDEVLAVGDEAFQHKCMDRIYAFKKRGVTILFVSHALGQVRNLCDRALWFDHGKLLTEGPSGEVVDQYMRHTNQLDAERLSAEHQEQAVTEEQPAAPGTAEPEAAVIAPADGPGQRWGSREAELTAVEFLDGQGEPLVAATTGQSLTIRMHYLAHERVTTPVFGLALYHRSGFHINGPNSRFAGLPIPQIEGRGFVDYHIPVLPLLDGDYLLTVTIYDYLLAHPFDHRDRQWSLRVYAASVDERFGSIYIPATWSWQPLPGDM